MTGQRHAALGIHAVEGADDSELLKRRQILRRTRWIALAVLLLLALGAGRTVLSRIANAKTLETGATEQARQYVKTTLPTVGTAGQTLALPGTLQGQVQAP